MIKVKGTKEGLETFRSYFESPPRIKAVIIKDTDDGFVVTVRSRDAEFIKYAAEKFGCTAEIGEPTLTS